MRLWRTAAVHRAQWAADPGAPLAKLVAEVWGEGELPARAVGLVDLTRVPAAASTDRRIWDQATAGRWLPNVVEVAGVRSLARAAWVVTQLAGVRLARRLRR